MRGIILAAGEGKRLMPFTSDRPKCMVEYQGTPILHRALAVMDECGVNDLAVVTGYRADAMVAPGARRYHNPQYATTNMVYSLFCAERELGDEVIISYGDIVYTPRILQALIDSPEQVSVVVDTAWEELWRARMEDPLADAESLTVRPDGSIGEIGKKPASLGEIQGQYIGLIKFSREAAARVKSLYHSLSPEGPYDGKTRDQMYMTSFLQIMIDRGERVSPVMVHGGWVEIDSPSDLAVRPVAER